jgi:hypothetical protein
LFFFRSFAWNFDSEAFTSSVAGLPNEAPPEEAAQGHVSRNRFNCPSPNRKRPSACLAETGQMAASKNQRDNATGSCSSVETDCGLDEEDSKPSLVTGHALIGSDPEQEARTNQRGKATGSCSSVEEDGGGRDEEDSKPSLVTSTSAALIDSVPDQEAVQEEAHGEIPSGWKVLFPFKDPSGCRWLMTMPSIRTHQNSRGNASSCSSVEEDGALDENGSKPSSVTAAKVQHCNIGTFSVQTKRQSSLSQKCSTVAKKTSDLQQQRG